MTARLLPLLLLLLAACQPTARPVAAVVVPWLHQTDGEWKIDPGTHVLTEPLLLNNPGGYLTTHVRGAGRSLLGTGGGGTTLIYTGPGPAIRVSGARDVQISDLTIKGPHYAELEWHPKGPKLEDWPASDRYAPTAGIEVGGFSSGVVIRNVDIAGFSVGLVFYPEGGDGQGEMVSLEHSRIAFCTYGISVSHTQNRRLTCRNVDFLTLHTATTNCVHGRQSGLMDAVFDSCHFNVVERLGAIGGYAGITTFRDCYGEQVARLGDFGDGWARSATPIAFRDCHWRTTGTGVLSDGGAILLDGGTIETPDLPVIGSRCEIRGTKFRPVWYERATTTQARKIVCNLASGPIPRVQEWSARPWLPQTAAWFPSTGQEFQMAYSGPQPARRVTAFPKSQCVLTATTIRLPNAAGVQDVKPGSIVQDDTGLATWYVTGSVGPVGQRTFTVERLNSGAVGPGGNFVAVSPTEVRR